MSLPARLRHELRAVALATLFFATWLAAFILLKKLILLEYRVDFSGFSKALIGALILSKVVLILEHVPLGAWVLARPAWVDLLLRTFPYSAGAAAVLAIEHGLRERHEHGGFVSAISAGIRVESQAHLLANTLCVAGALLAYNTLSIIRRHLGTGALSRIFLSPPDEARR